MPFVVTGTGHSGTAWTSRVFTQCGVRTGHESICRFVGYIDTWDTTGKPVPGAQHAPTPGPLDGDASLAAVGYMHAFPPGTRVLHVLRHPLAVVRSLHALGYMADTPQHRASPYGQFVATHLPEAWDHDDHLDRIVAYTLGWNDLAHTRAVAAGLPYLCERVEQLGVNVGRTWGAMCWAAQRAVPKSFVRKALARWTADTNRHRRSDVDLVDLSRWARSQLEDWCDSHGYRPEP